MSASMKGDRLREGLQALRDGFLERVTTRCLAIEGILAELDHSDEGFVAEADREAIQQHAHKTAGVAATFGFSVLGEKALAVEQLMARADGTLPWSVARPDIEALLDEMEDALDEFS